MEQIKTEEELQERKKPFYYKALSKTTISVITLLILILVVIGASVYLSKKHSELGVAQIELKSTEEISNLGKEANSYEHQASDYDKTAGEFYSTATFSLDGKDWVDAYSNCQKARDYSSKAGDAYRLAKAKWEKAYKLVTDTELKSIISLAINMDNAGSEIQYNRYEACEGIETASHYFLQNDITMGNQYLESANEKIKLHDYWVTVYNEYLAKRKV